jgi:hypothetical protein
VGGHHALPATTPNLPRLGSLMTRLSFDPGLGAVDALCGRSTSSYGSPRDTGSTACFFREEEVLPSKRVRGNVQPVVGTLATQKSRTFELIDQSHA